MAAILGSPFPFELDSEGSVQCVVEVITDAVAADEALAQRDGPSGTSDAPGDGSGSGSGSGSASTRAGGIIRRGSVGEGLSGTPVKTALDVNTFSLIDEDDSDAAESEPPTPKLEIDIIED